MTADEKIINVMILSSFYEKIDINKKTRFLLLEPIILLFIRNKHIEKSDLVYYINSLFDNKINIADNIISSHIHSQFIKYNKSNKEYYLDINDKINEKLDLYESIKNNNLNELNKLKIFILGLISPNVLKDNNINNFNISEYIYNFFYKRLEYSKKNNFENNEALPQIEKNIANILNECYTNYKDNIDIFKNIIQGIVILKAIENYKNSNLNNQKKPEIYVDNIFIQNLFGWCDDINYDNTILMLNTLKDLNFNVFIHSITLELINEYAVLAKKMNVKDTKVNDLAFYIHNAYTDNTKLDIINNCNFENLHNKFLSKLEEYNIDIKTNLNFKDFNNNKTDTLYDKVHKYRQENNEIKGYSTNINELQTIYDSSIILRYNNFNINNKNSLENMNEIFLTYHSAIINHNLIKIRSIYKPIMNIKNFINLLLLEAILSNIKNDKLIDIFLLNTYNGILSDEFDTFIKKIYEETDITDEDRELLLSSVYYHDVNIIKNDSNTTKMLKYLKQNDKAIKNKDRVIKERDNTIRNKDNTIRNKDNIIRNKDKVIKQKDNAIRNKDKVIRKKNKYINKKDEIISDKDDIINKKDEIINDKDTIINKKDKIIIFIITFIIVFFIINIVLTNIDTSNYNTNNLLLKIIENKYMSNIFNVILSAISGKIIELIFDRIRKK